MVDQSGLGRLWITGTQIEDAAESAGGELLMCGAVRRNAAASSSASDGDNSTLNTDALGSDKELASAAGGVAMGDGGSAVTPKEDLHKEYENEAFVAEVPAPDVPIGGAPDTAVQV